AEAYRNNDRILFEEEIADTFIRLLDIVGTLNIDIEAQIQRKMDINFVRPKQHGKVMGDVVARKLIKENPKEAACRDEAPR
ncbi:unnamed protein product, partial [marine sediment metagenome]